MFGNIKKKKFQFKPVKIERVIHVLIGLNVRFFFVWRNPHLTIDQFNDYYFIMIEIF